MAKMSSVSSSTVVVAVDKATSDLLLTPDWAINIEICDFLNSNRWQTKDVVKAVKKRLLHKNPRVQLLALTLLETMVKNCGDYLHYQIAEKNILGEMVKMVKKKADMQVRNKILILVNSWRETFGGPGAKHSHYYSAYEELRRSGVQFPQRLQDAGLGSRPSASRSGSGSSNPDYGMHIGSSRRLDETMATATESLSLSSLESMRHVMELLNDMVQAVNPDDRSAIKDEVIVDLVDRCRSDQKKLIQMLTTTGDEEVLARGLQLNDSMQIVLAGHDAIASGSHLPLQAANSISRSTDTAPKPTEVKEHTPESSYSPPAPATSSMNDQTDKEEEEEEEEDDFTQLARRHSKPRRVPSDAKLIDKNEGSMSTDNHRSSHAPSSSDPTQCKALAVTDPPEPVKTTKEEDIIDLLSITLSTTLPTPQTPQPASNSPDQNFQQIPVSAGPQAPQVDSYVVPWAQPQLRKQSEHEPWQQTLSASQAQLQPQMQPQMQLQPQAQYTQFSYVYPPPPWAASPGNITGMSSPYTSVQQERQFQQSNSFPVRGSNGNPCPTISTVNPATTMGPKPPFIPSYRLFEELNVFWNADERLKLTYNRSPSFQPAAVGESMIGGRK